jgi:hypothetical protein
MPETDISPQASPFISNCFLKDQEIRSRPRLITLFPAPPDGTNTLALVSFIDVNAVVHTVAITRLGIYQLSSNWPTMIQSYTNPWLVLSNFSTGQLNAIYATAVLQAKLYFTNGGSNVFQWNGLTNTIQTVDGLADGTTFGAFFMMELNAKLVCAYTIETKAGTTNVFPFRVRWSATTLPATNPFDPSVNLGAGFNDEFDVPDAITGIAPIGRTGYIYRNNGITEMIPNSSGSGFDFDHLWASDRGIGNILSQTLAGFGPMNIFVSGDEIYKITPNSFDAIGKRSLNAIKNDLANAVGFVTGHITPYIVSNFVYPTYHLLIDFDDKLTVDWVYSIKDDNWMRQVFNQKRMTCKPRYVYLT